MSLRSGQTSSTYVGDRGADNIPPWVSTALLDLHYVCLVQARSSGLISPNGSILSSIGGRIGLDEILAMADAAGYTGRILSLSWKEQSEPESVIGGYAENEIKSGKQVCPQGFDESEVLMIQVPLLPCVSTGISLRRTNPCRGWTPWLPD